MRQMEEALLCYIKTLKKRNREVMGEMIIRAVLYLEMYGSVRCLLRLHTMRALWRNAVV